MSDMERELDWEDSIEKEGSEFVTLPEGDYPFTVESFERGRSRGSDKLPPCNMAILKIKVDGGALGNTTVTENLVLHTKMEWKLSSFFASIGLKKKGEPLRMDWGKVPGAVGRAHVSVDTYKNNEGEDRKINRIKDFHPAGQPAFKAGEF